MPSSTRPTSCSSTPGRTRIRYSDISRIEGDLHLAKGKPDPALAESCYLEAIAIAIMDKAKIPQLRASLRLAQLWLTQGKASQARELLRPVYHSFTEGHETTDLIKVQQLLGELEPERSL